MATCCSVNPFLTVIYTYTTTVNLFREPYHSLGREKIGHSFFAATSEVEKTSAQTDLRISNGTGNVGRRISKL